MPYIDYAINKDYIVSNLCINRYSPQSNCDGKCYLEKQIQENAESNDLKEENTPKKVQNEVVNEFISSHVIQIKLFESPLIQVIQQDIFITARYLNAIFIPPR